ncbi:PD-(D/E)XK nuclease family protein [Priestia megaterium]
MSKLEKYSYSKLSTFTQCPMKYYQKYVQGNYDQSDAIHLDLGNILHKVLEIKFRNIIDNVKVDYGYLKEITYSGVKEETNKSEEFIIGVNEIIKKYGEDLFNKVDQKSGLSYKEKMSIFMDYLHNEEINDWKPIVVEQKFEFEYEGKAILGGYIDRIDENKNGDLRVVDYKSSNKVFDEKELPTPLQMMIYTLACENIFGKQPIEHRYDFIMIGDHQLACTKGYYKRGIKKLNKIFDEIEWYTALNEFKPKPTPLCHWCSFSKTNPNALWYMQDLCDYYSLWTPDNKTFAKNKEYEG